MNRVRKELMTELFKNGLINTENCSDEENEKYQKMELGELPNDVAMSPTSHISYYRYKKSELTDEEMKLYLLTKQNSTLRIIKGCVIFFVVLAIIGIIMGFVGISQIHNAIHSVY